MTTTPIPTATLEAVREEIKCVRQWDMLDAAADGPAIKERLDRSLALLDAAMADTGRDEVERLKKLVRDLTKVYSDGPAIEKMLEENGALIAECRAGGENV